MMQRKSERFSWRKWVRGILSPVLAVLIAFILGGVVAMIGNSNLVVAYRALYEGAFGSPSAIQQTIRYAIPILVIAMSFSICNQCGFFFIGQKGIMFLAAIGAAWVQVWFPSLPMPVMLILMILAGVIIGAVVAVIPAVFKLKFGVNEAMIFVMLDYIVVFLVEYFLLYTAICSPGSAAMPKSIPILPRISSNALYGITILLTAVFAIFMRFSVTGYRIRITGKNEVFARSCGVNTGRTLLVAATIGGGCAGLAGLFEILGVYHTVYYNFAEGNLAFMGITAALLGCENPIGMVFASLVLGAMQSGSIALSTKTDVPSELVSVIIGLIMFFATVNFIRDSRKRSPIRGQAKKKEAST